MSGNGNLIPLKPGQSLPGAGRKKGSLGMTTILRKMLEEKVDDPDTGKRITRKELVVKKLLQIGQGDSYKAKESDVLKALEMIFDRTEGKALQEVKIQDERLADQIITFE
jgi:hypothetical protein